MFAYLDENDTVRELIAMPRADLEYYYPPDFVVRCVECGEEVQQGWTWDGEAFSPPPGPTLEEARAEALEKLRLRKWQAKDAGISVNGISIDTDDKGQATINGAVTNVLLDPAFTATWKTSAVDENGQSIWMALTGEMIVALSQAMTRYTEACFTVEAQKQAELAACQNAADIQDWLTLYLDEGWPEREMTL